MREEWGSRHGFILATIGAAVGIGNVWRFSYIAGQNGGAAFLLVYVGAVVLIGLPIVLAELALGRQGRGDAVAAFARPGDRSPWRHVGWIGVVGACVILSYYAVIAGWALKYFAGAATGGLWHAAVGGSGAYFAAFIADTGEPVVWQFAMLAASAYVVAGGVRQGIENLNRWLMPLLALIILALAGFAMTLENAAAGLRFLFAPDWSVLSKADVYIAALGQAFFSLGVGMAVFVTYGGYIPRHFPLPVSAATIAIGDSLFAIVAGMAIFPAVFAFGIDPTSGPELAFVTLPQVFLHMPAGTVLGALFFFLLAAAALTSMVALLEVPVAVAVQRFGARRWRATGILAIAIFILGLPSAMSFGPLADYRIAGHGILDAVDAAVSNLLLPGGGVLIALYVGWRTEKAAILDEAELGSGPLALCWLWLMRLAVPLAIASILMRAAGDL